MASSSTTNTGPPKIRAALFDMDGLLIDSEDYYTICTNEVLAEYGKPNLPWHIKAQLQGRPGPQAGRIFHEWAQLPISPEEYLVKVKEQQEKFFPQCKPLPGVPSLLKTLRNSQNPKIQLALATSSHTGNFKLKTSHLSDLFSVFDQDKRVLGDDPRIPKGRGKPAPDIWLLALKLINDDLKEKNQEIIKPEECLVFEDSVPGLESARRAGMQAVWCPHPELYEEYKGREELVLAGLLGEYDEGIQPKVETAGQDVHGKPGEVGDGWAIFLKSLEDFPYERYGIQV